MGGTTHCFRYDYLIKVSGVNGVKKNITDGLGIPEANAILDSALIFRTMRLNCLLRVYSPIWKRLFAPSWELDYFVAANDATVKLGDLLQIGPLIHRFVRTTTVG